MDFGGRLFFLYEWKEALLRYKPVQYCFSLLARMQSWRAFRNEDHFGALSNALRVARDLSAVGQRRLPVWVHGRILNSLGEKGWQQLVASYRVTGLAQAHRGKYYAFPLADRLRIRQPKKNPPRERQGDLMVLKPFRSSREKGVLFLNFDETVDKFFALYDVEKIARDYRLVFEPSAWGYQQPRMFLLYGLATDVVVEAQYQPDYNYIAELGGSLKPIRIGAGDWVDFETFRSGREEKKLYDLVMIANWLKWKRHKLLFQALQQLGDEIGRVALIGYPIEGRTSDEIRQVAHNMGVGERIDIFENISAAEVGRIIQRSKIGIMLSKKEGANRGIYECFFSDVPVILTDQNIGVNRDHINTHTGMLAADDELFRTIRRMLAGHEGFQSRSWALTKTGWKNSSRQLNDFLRTLAMENQEEWTSDIFPKMNGPLPVYTNEEDRIAADRDVERLNEYLL